MSVLFILETAEDIISEITERADLLWTLIENSVKDGFQIKRIALPKVISGTRDIPKNLASEIIKNENIDKKHFEFYIDNFIKNGNSDFITDTLIENLPNNPYGVNTDSLDAANCAFYFSEIWFKYLRYCANKPQKRNKNKPVAIDPLDIDERIKKVVKDFKYIDEANTKFTAAKKVKEKIDKQEEFHLFKKIEGNVNDYFDEIRKMFVEEQETNDLVYEQVRRKIRNQYLSRKDKTPQQIFNSLVDCLMNEVQSTDREACEAVMSYFVQSCEVFGK